MIQQFLIGPKHIFISLHAQQRAWALKTNSPILIITEWNEFEKVFFPPDDVGCLEGLSKGPEELVVAQFVLKQCLFSAARWRTHSCRLFNVYWYRKWQFCNSYVAWWQRSVNLSSWLVIVGGTSVRYARRDFSLGSSVFSSSPELTFLRCTLHLSSPSYIVHRIWDHLPT